MAVCRRTLALLLLASCAPAHAQAPDEASPVRTLTEADFDAIRAGRIVTAIRTAERITVDGRLEEPAWQIAQPATDFLQRVPRTGAPATERTEVRFVYDDETLYVGVKAFDTEPSRQIVKELKEDFDINGTDMVQLILDSLHDRRSGFALSVNPAGARRDSQFSQNGQSNQDWDGVWDAKVSHAEDAWFIEYAIPFRTLRFTEAPSQEWGLQVARRIPRRNEEGVWSPLPVRFQANRLDLAGTLRGLTNLRQGRNLKVKPYILAQHTQTRIDGEFTTIDSLGRWQGYNGGFDVKYSLTPSLTLDTTVRTDFAQVEVDQQQVNLTRFNLFFPEKRDFFLENAGIFSFGAPQQNFQGGGGAGGGGGGGNNNQANLVPFFSRRIGLSAAGTPVPIVGGGRVTGQVNGYDVGLLAMRTEQAGETPSNNYLVGRVRRNFLGNSFVGALVTSRDSTLAGDYNRVYGTDLHLQFFQKLDVDSYILRSETPGLPELNQARRLQTSWRDDDLNASVEYNAVQPNFRPEVGFVRRDNMSQYSGDFSWLPRMEQNDTIRNLVFNTSVDYFNSGTTGDIETRTQEARTGVQFENNGSVNFIVNRTFDRLVEPFQIRSNIDIPAGDYDYLNYRAEGNIGNSRRVLTGGSYTWGEFWDGRNRGLSGNLGLRLNYHWSLDLNYSRNAVTLPYGAFTTELVGVRFLYAFTSRAFVNAFFQYNADTKQVSSNIRFNLTHRPLSDVYLVYNDTRDSRTGQIAGRALMIKLTNLFDF
jgi:hypothetical protein